MMVDEKHYYNRIYAPRLAPLMHDKDAEIERLNKRVAELDGFIDKLMMADGNQALELIEDLQAERY